MGQVFHRLGTAHYLNSNFEEAINLTQKAIKYKERGYKNKPIEIANSYFNIAKFYKESYNYSESIIYYQKAIKIYQTHKNIKVTDCYNDLSYIYQSLGDYETAISYTQLSKPNIKEDTLAYIKNRITLGIALFRKNNIKQSQEILKNILTINKNVNSEYTNLISINLANTYVKLKQYDQAIEMLKSIQPSDDEQKGICWNNIGYCYLKKGNYALAEFYSSKALKIRNINKALRIEWLINSSELYFEQKEYPKAFAKNREADNLLQTSNKHSFNKEKFSLYEQQIDFIRRINKFRSNIKLLSQADSLIDLMRQEHTELGSKLFWREKTHTFYENAIETCYQLKDHNKAFYFMEKSRAILLLDALKDLDAKKILSKEKLLQEQTLCYKIIGFQNKLANIPETAKNYTQIYQQLISAKEEYKGFIQSLEETNREYYQLKYENKYISLSNLQSVLKSNNQSFIEYFFGEKTVYAFLATTKETRMIKIDLQEYQSLSKQFLSLSAQKPPHTSTQLKEFYRIANQLYQLIFAPLNIPFGRVIISQDNYFLPFSALVADVEKQKFLVEDYAFSYSYSANILFREKEKQISFNKRLLGFSPIHYNKSLNLNTLSGSDQVLNNIQEKYFSGKLFFEKQATKQNFIQNASDYKIIQLFTHGKADTVSDKSKIYFYDDALNMNELYKLGKLNAELVVLSACETNLGSNATGEGIMSFARGFAYLGVPSTVSTLWSVNNQSTYQLTESFYKYLDDGNEKDIALQMAQKDYLKNSGYKFPYYWSGVVLVGDSNKMTEINLSIILFIFVLIVFLLVKTYYGRAKPKI